MISDQALEVLRSTTLFAGFTDEQLRAVPLAAVPHTFGPGEHLIREGEPAERTMWLILEGGVEIKVGDRLLRTEGPGSHIGEMSLLTNAPRSADVVATQTTTALALTYPHLRGLIHADPDVALEVMAELARRLQHLTETVRRLARTSPEAASAAKERGIDPLAQSAPTDLDPIGWHPAP